jgi:hypothetical protein
MFAASKTASVSGGYQISRSLRFNSADTAYLNRTPATATNRRTWTWSAWVKRSALGAIQELFDGYWANTDNGYFWVGFTSADAFEVQLYNTTLRTTTQVFRDPSAWYHLVLAVDTTQATAANRVKVYLNGSEITTFSTNNAPTQNLDTAVNYNGAHYIGTFSGSSNLFNGYMTEINLIDGSQLTPSSFGETDTQTGVWKPKAYSGSYGTNGFYLNFSDNSNTTAATLGKDYSGNGNNWTPNNFSVTAGAGNDSLVDSPTSYGVDTGAGGSVRGNYCTMNPIANPSTPTYSITNGNLDYATTGGSGNASKQAAIATIGVTTGKWYYEGTVTSNNAGLGFSSELFLNSQRGTIRITYFSGSLANSAGITATGSPATFTNGDVIAVAYDADAGTATVYKNNASQGTFSGIATGTALFPYVEPNTADSGSGVSFNFGQRPFAYTAPSGFKALCTQNFPTPTIGATSNSLANQFFTPVIYTGTNATQTITVGFETGLLWGKERSTPDRHWLADQVRGLKTTGYYLLSTNNTSADTSSAAPDGVTAITSTGFTLGANTSNTDGNWSYEINANTSTYVAWNWKANGSGSSNTAGQITSTVSANTTSGFSIVTFTTDGTTKTVGHGLGVAPKMIIVKQRDATSPWYVFTTVIDGTYDYLVLNTTDAASNSSYTAPTATVFEYNDDNAATQVAYCFAEIAGYSKFGSYTGNGSTDGPFIYTGFRPAFVMIKSTSFAEDWTILDSERNPYNVADEILKPNTFDSTYVFSIEDFVSNGFKLKSTGSLTNSSGNTYIYMALAESPFKYSLAR